MFAASSHFTAAATKLARNRRGAFTLIELLVVISIIALLMSVLLPALGAAREEGKSAKCGAELHAIGIAMTACQNDYNGFYPMWDDGERSTVHNRVIASWLDALKQRHMYGVEGGYCPSDRRPDFLNAQRGAAWGFNYPNPASFQGSAAGVDYSYGISIPLASGAHMSGNTYDVNGVSETTRLLLQRNVDRRVLVGDAYWDWIHNMSQFALKFNQFDVGNWFSNTAAYRHGMINNTGKPSGNYLMQDMHVQRVRYDLTRFNRGLDTNVACITYPGEPLNIYPALGTGAAGAPAEGFPPEIDPYEITGATATNAQWLGEIRMRKGWD